MSRKATPEADHRQWTAAQVEAHAHKALSAALEYFRIPDSWEVVLQVSGGDEDAGAEISMSHDYLRGVIVLNTEHLRSHPRKVWEYVGHECAHLAMAAYDAFWTDLPAKVQSKYQRGYVRAMEQTVTQQTRMFLRDVPDPEA